VNDIANGIHRISWRDYLLSDRMNWSMLKLLGKAPALYRHRLLNPEDDDTDEKRLGRATHAATLEPERFRRDFVMYPDRRASKAWDAFKEKHAEQEILTEAGWEKALAISTAVRTHPDAARFLSGGRAEHAVFWTHREPGVGGVPGFEVQMKCRVDFLCNAKAINDLKTTRDAGPSAFGRAAFNLEYYVQGAVNVDAVHAVTGEWWPFYITAVESHAPYLVQVYQLTDEHLELGRERYRDLLRLYDVCRRDNHWPSYATTVMDLVLPAWATPNPEDEIEDLGLVVNS
jgi:hypothetical protein